MRSRQRLGLGLQAAAVLGLPLHDQAGEQSHAEEDGNLQEIPERRVSVIDEEDVRQIDERDQTRRPQPASEAEPDPAQGDRQVVEPDEEIVRNLMGHRHQHVAGQDARDQQAQD